MREAGPLAVLRYEPCDECGRISRVCPPFEVLEERIDLWADGVLPSLLRWFLGASDASFKSVETRCIRGGCGEVGRRESAESVGDVSALGTMKPYLSSY